MGNPKLVLCVILSIQLIAMLGSAQASGNQNRKSCLKLNAYGLCVMCNREFFLEDNLCYLCSNACKKCESRDTCASCFRGYRIDKDGKCIWVVFYATLYLTLGFIGLIILILIGGAVFAKKFNILKMLAGDDFQFSKVAGQQGQCSDASDVVPGGLHNMHYESDNRSIKTDTYIGL